MKLTEENFITYAMHNYDNVQCTTTKEFTSDLKRFTYLNKLFNKYCQTGELKERLVLNHLIVLYNLWNFHLNEMLFFKIEKSYWPYLLVFMIYLKRLPESGIICGIKISDIPLDETIIDVLRRI